jgi:hypothetical protein
VGGERKQNRDDYQADNPAELGRLVVPQIDHLDAELIDSAPKLIDSAVETDAQSVDLGFEPIDATVEAIVCPFQTLHAMLPRFCRHAVSFCDYITIPRAHAVGKNPLATPCEPTEGVNMQIPRKAFLGGLGALVVAPTYKELTGLGNAVAARRAVARVAALPFFAPGSDCLDAVRMVLTQYGVSFTKAQRETPVPNHFFFDLLPGDPQPINAPWPGTIVDASFYTEYGRMKFRDDVLSTTDAVVFDNDISYDPTSDYPQVAWSAFVARRGYLAL